MDRWSELTKARKAWVCTNCQGEIKPGDFYKYEADRGTGANVARICAICDPPEMMTICDRCAREIPLAEANDGGDHGTLCNDCYAEMELG